MGLWLFLCLMAGQWSLYGYQSTIRLLDRLGYDSYMEVEDEGETVSYVLAEGRSDFQVRIALSSYSSWEAELEVPQKTEGMTDIMLRLWIHQEVKDCQFFIALEDENSYYKEKDITKLLRRMKNQWGNLKIHLKEFYELDLQNIKKVRFIIRSGSDAGDIDLKMKKIDFRGTKIDAVQIKKTQRLRGVKTSLFGRSQKQLVQICEQSQQSQSTPFLEKIYEDLWWFLSNAVDKQTELPVDNLHLYPKVAVGDYTSPTNIAVYMMVLVSGRDYGLISNQEAQNRLSRLLDTLSQMERWKGCWYNFYNTQTLEVTREYVSSVDLGWIVAGLIVVRNACPELKSQVNNLLKDVNFHHLLHKKYGQLYIGYEADKKEYPPYHYGLVATEIRIASLVAIALKHVPKLHWYQMFRAFPPKWDWQNGTPVGTTRTVKGLEEDKFYQLYYQRESLKVVPSWGGSMFEALMPALVCDEKKLSPKGFYKNGINNVKLQISFAQQQGLPIWGFSPCATPDGGYVEAGVREAAVKGYEERELVTPHASFLALPYLFEEAVDNMKTMLELYPIYGAGGFYDSIQFKGQKAIVSYRYLYLDQGMSFLAMTNMLQDGILWKYFENDEDISQVIDLLDEEFFPEPTAFE